MWGENGIDTLMQWGRVNLGLGLGLRFDFFTTPFPQMQTVLVTFPNVEKRHELQMCIDCK